MNTGTLHTVPYLLRSTKEADELRIVSVSWKYSHMLPVTKWVDVLLINLGKEPLKRVVVVDTQGLTVWIPKRSFQSKPFVLAETLHPLEGRLMSIPLRLDYLKVWITLSFARGRQNSTKTIEVQEYPDSDDFESHGIYNLLDYRGPSRAVDSNDIRERLLFEEILLGASSKPQLLELTSPRRFEEIVGELFARFGFRVEHVGRTADGGVDLLAVSENEFSSTLHLTVQEIQGKSRSGTGAGTLRRQV